jgi:adenylate cyclase
MHGSLAPLYGNHDAGVCALYFGAWSLGLLGLPDRAVEMSRAAIAQAEQLAHPFSQALSRFFAAVVHQCRGEPAAVRERAEAAMVLARAHGFGLTLAWATTLLGWAISREGHPEDGLGMIRRGTAAARDTGSEAFRSYFLALLADACMTAGSPADGLAAVAEALATVEKTGERFYEAELYRLKGELLRRQEQDVPRAALVPGHPLGGGSPEECLVKAIEVARRQGARSLELRAVVSVSRVWREQGREAEARRTLADACSGFTEGLETADLREAQALLNAMPAP